MRLIRKIKTKRKINKLKLRMKAVLISLDKEGRNKEWLSNEYVKLRSKVIDLETELLFNNKSNTAINQIHAKENNSKEY